MVELESEVFQKLQDLYNLFMNLYKEGEEKGDILRIGRDGFKSALVYLENGDYFQVLDKYSDSMYFIYNDNYGSIILNPSLDGLYYGSRVMVNEERRVYTGVKEIVNCYTYLQSIYEKLSKLKIKTKVKVK